MNLKTHLCARNNALVLDALGALVHQRTCEVGVGSEALPVPATKYNPPHGSYDRAQKHVCAFDLELGSHGRPTFVGEILVPAMKEGVS